MTLMPLTERHEIEMAYPKVTERLKAGMQAFDRKIGFHGGYKQEKVYGRDGLGFWWLLNRTVAGDRWWCCYGIENPRHRDMLSITVETNFPSEGVNRRISGLFVKDDAGQVYITHSGKVGGGRSGIGKEAFWKSCGGEQVETVQWPDGQKSRTIVISPVDSEHLPAHIARLVPEVARFKAAAASGKPAVRRERLRRIFTLEFEGQRRGYMPAGEIEARGDHGTVVRRLYEALTAAGHEGVNDRRDLYTLAGDKVTHLFEVKTDLSTTSLYQGVGQLTLDGAAVDPVPRQILVVPGQPNTATRQALGRLGIAVLAFNWGDGGVVFSRLDDVLRQGKAEPWEVTR